MALKKRLLKKDIIKYGNKISGPILIKEFECSSKGFKEKLEELLSDGLVVKYIETEPILYKYKIHYYSDKRQAADLANEEWRDIPGEFYGQYQISSLGRIRSIRVLKEYERTVLTDSNFNRISVNVKKLQKKIFEL